MEKVIAFIHAKGHSERIPNKNLRKLGDRPLICHALTNALKCKNISEVIIDSDSETILQTGVEYGATNILRRPKHLATDETTGDDLAYWQAFNYPDSDICIQVVPTSPFIKPETIDNCIDILSKYNGINTVIGIQKITPYTWNYCSDGSVVESYRYQGRILNSQEMASLYIETTGLYAFKTDYALKHRMRTSPLSYLFELSPVECVDINEEDDFEFAEIVWRGLNA